MINPVYSPAPDRYERGIRYRRCGRSGILLPEISLGFWHNFGDVNPLANSLEMAHYAFDHGIVHFDLAMVVYSLREPISMCLMVFPKLR